MNSTLISYAPDGAQFAVIRFGSSTIIGVRRKTRLTRRRRKAIALAVGFRLPDMPARMWPQ